MRHEKSCGAVVFRHTDGEWSVLLIRHERGRHVSFPKGHVERGETESQTAEREVLEETGVRVSVDTGFRAENRYFARADIDKLVVFFTAVADNQQPVAQRGEVAQAEWVDVEEAKNRLTYAPDREILLRAYRYVLEKAS